VVLPEDYCIQKFLQLAGYPKPKHNGSIIEGGCPICKEGKSWGRKRRLYYMVKDGYVYCHNCGWSGDPFKFIQQQEGLTFNEILNESKDYDILPKDLDLNNETKRVFPDQILPTDSINLYDQAQIDYYKDSEIVKRVYDTANERKLFSACNRPKTLWVSLSDYVHKNRLVLPFYDEMNNIVFYQSRTVFPSEKFPKYLSKTGSDKTLFNLNNIDPNLDKLFIFEGPIDACFVKNGIAVAGIQEGDATYTSKQQEQLQKYNLFDKIWVLDSQWLDSTSKTKSISLAEQGETVFIWPEDYGKRFKDFNDMAIGLGTNEIPYKFILDNSHTGLKAQVILSQI
jgi:hypothetical protein